MNPDLSAVLHRARDLGFLGPGPVELQFDHAMAFAAVVEAPSRALDLGSGGGVPGLVLATEAWPDSRWLLVDAGQRRCTFLAEAVMELGLDDRVDVACGRAEVLGREPSLRGRFDLVVARGFAPPAVTAECAAPFLRRGGRLVVSDPPGGDPARWPPDGLARLGLAPSTGPDPGPVGQFAMASFVQVEMCDDRFPRRTGVPAKRPLFR